MFISITFMKNLLLLILFSAFTFPVKVYPDAGEILKKVDANMNAKTRIITSKMIINGRRGSRTVSSKSYSEGDTKAFTEYLSPEREKGTKMLKLDDMLWIYSPSSDRTIQLSGHMLRQSVMGSDMSYEEVMEDRKLTDLYNAKVLSEEMVNDRKSWVLELDAKVSDVAYTKRKTWIDQERYVPLKEELYAKSGKLLKKITYSNVAKVNGRWFPKKVNYKDMLKTGNGTDFIMESIQLNPSIPDYIFSKASLKK